MKSTEMLKKIKTFLVEDKVEETIEETVEETQLESQEEIKEEVKVELAQAKLENGTVVESESFKAGDEIFIITDDEKVAMPVGEYVMEDGKLLVVEEEGIIADYREVSDDVPQKEDEMAEDDEAAVDDWAGMEKRIKNLEDAVADLKREIGETGDVEEMAEETPEEVSDKPKTIKTTEVVEFSVDELKAENEKLKAELAAKPADVALNTNKFSSEKPVLSRKEYRKLSSKERFLHDLNK